MTPLGIFPLLLLLLNLAGDADREDGEDELDKGEPTEGRAGEEEEIRDPVALIKSLREQKDRFARKLKERDKRIAELEQGQPAQGDELRAARIEAAFLRAANTREDPIADLDMAWDLMNLRHFVDAVEVGEDGTVSNMEEVLDRVVDRYPFIVAGYGDPPADTGPKPGGRPVGPVRRSGPDQGSLEARFPALRRRRWRPR